MLDRLARAWAQGDPEARFEAVYAAFITEKGTLRERKSSKAHEKRFGLRAGRLLELHASLGAAVLAAQASRCEERAYLFNRHALTAGAAFLALDRLFDEGAVSRDETVVVFNTGTGFKYVENMAPLWGKAPARR